MNVCAVQESRTGDDVLKPGARRLQMPGAGEHESVVRAAGQRNTPKPRLITCFDSRLVRNVAAAPVRVDGEGTAAGMASIAGKPTAAPGRVGDEVRMEIEGG